MITNSKQFAGLKETWDRLGRIDLASKPVIISLVVAHALTVFGFELGRVGQDPLLTLSIALMAEVLFWGTYLTLYALQVWLLKDKSSVLVKVFIIVFSNMVRTLSLEFALFQFGLMDELRIADRFLGDTTGILLVLLGIAYIQVAVAELGEQEIDLVQARAQLSDNARASRFSAQSADQQLRVKAQEILGDQLQAITSYLKSAKTPNAERLTSEIQELIDEKVRPLSVDLWRRLDSMADPTLEAQGPKKSKLPRVVYPASDFRPLVVIMISGLNIFITAPGLADWTLAWAFAPWILTFPLLGWALNAVYPKRLGSNLAVGISVIGAMSLISWLPSIGFLLLHAREFPELQVLSFTSSSVIVFTTTAVGIWSAFKRERLSYLEQIDEINKERSRQLALIEQAVWVARRNWSYLVHGTVQGALTVAISRVQLAKTITKDLAAQVLQDVERARAALNQTQPFSQSWTEVWPQIEQTWDGVCQVTHSITPEAEALLGSSSATSTCVAEIAKELVSNAFRHGKATRVDISISAATEQDLRITSTNNGSSVQKGRVEGIGSEMFDELTTQWSWKNTPKGPRFTALVPVGTNP